MLVVLINFIGAIELQAYGSVSPMDTIETRDLKEVTVRARRRNYNFDSPAVRLIKRLIASRDSSRMLSVNQFAEFQRYERIVVALDNYQPIDENHSLSFLNSHSYRNPKTGKEVLPISLREKVVQSARGRGNSYLKDSVLYRNSQGVDDRFSSGTVLAFLNEAVPEIDLFANHIYLVNRQFVSPLSTDAYNFYRYHLHKDTIDYEGVRAVKLEFFPFSNHSLSLRGTLTVNIDSLSKGAPYILKAELSIPNTADANFIYNLSIEQYFARDSSGVVLLLSDDVHFDLSPNKSMPALNIKRSNIYSNYNFPKSFKQIRKPSQIVEIAEVSEKFQLTEQEREVADVARGLRSNSLWTIFEETMLMVVEGYYQTGKKSYFDIGPVAQFLSGNSVEGTRLAFGGMTTPNLSEHIFFDGLVAYGFDDKRWKTDLSLEWSFLPKDEIYKEFPVHSLRATYSYDIHTFGSSFDLLDKENVLSWAKRSGDTKLTYVELFQLRYMREWANSMSMQLYARNYNTAGSSNFSFLADPLALQSYRMSELELRLRFAPGERIYQTRRTRRNLNKYIPTIELSHTVGFKGLLGGDYSRNETTLSGMGRINLQPFGFMDVVAKVGAEWGEVPYMLLPHPSTNLTYFTSDVHSFSLMRPLEFLYDRYAHVGVDYHLDGLILSRIPLIKLLKWREIVSFRAVYGELTDRNNPLKNTSLVPLPLGSSPIGDEPYMELGVGVDNILSIFRVEYVWRLNYLTPAVSSGAILFDFSLKF